MKKNVWSDVWSGFCLTFCLIISICSFKVGVGDFSIIETLGIEIADSNVGFYIFFTEVTNYILACFLVWLSMKILEIKEDYK